MSFEKKDFLIREAVPADAKAILDIYTPYIENTVITFEYEVPSLEAFEQRMLGIMGEYPYLVCEQDGRVIGYAYAHRYRERAAFAWGAELSVYLDLEYQGCGAGTALYLKLIDCLKRQNIKTVYGIVAHPNEASERLHQKLGFRLVGISEKCGYKLGRWVDLAYFEKEIGTRNGVPEAVRRFEEVRS